MADEIKRMGDYIVQTPGSELSYTEAKDWALAIADLNFRSYQIKAQRSGFDLERRSSGASARRLLM